MKKKERIYFTDECDTLCIDSKDTKKRELKLAKEEYKNLTKFVDSELNSEYESAALEYIALGAGFLSSGALLTAGIANSDVSTIVVSGAVFLMSLGLTKQELSGPRKDRKEYTKPLKQAKKKYKNMYKDRVFEIKENYLFNKDKEEEKQKTLVKK